jgi:predicted DNA-binding transcriptional regulator YafY
LPSRATAILPVFSRSLADEEWHPEQLGELDGEGRYVLEVPFADPTELTMDILRHGHHVEVLSPPELRLAVMAEIERMHERYAVNGL